MASGTNGFEQTDLAEIFAPPYGNDMNSTNRLILGLVLLGAVGVTSPAYAYLDPGTGSMLVQMLLGGVAGALVVGKLYWHQVKAFFGRGPRKNYRQEPSSHSDAE